MYKFYTVALLFIVLLGNVCAISSRPRYVTPSQNYHIVAEGETLQDISKMHDISSQKLMVYNNMKSRRVFVGQKIYLYPKPEIKRDYITPRSIPENKMHQVQAGETIGRIAKMYDVGIIELIDYNNLSSLELTPGQKLYLAPDIKTSNAVSATSSPQSNSNTKKYTTKETPNKQDPSQKLEEQEFTSISKPKFNKIKTTRNRSSPGLIAPIEGTVTSEFGTRNGSHHKGIDIAADVGEPICAVADGKVVYVGSQRGYGNVVILEHDDYVMTVYAHNETNLVRLGEIVKQGQPIATLGNTGSTDGPHLHFEYRVQGKAIDPRQVLPGL
jgi:murein DD-endopeptidase MepM/ murein hydrolase activator NlpD